jgi:hypothetical protein
MQAISTLYSATHRQYAASQSATAAVLRAFFVGLPLIPWKSAPLPDDLAFSVFLVHFPFAFGPTSIALFGDKLCARAVQIRRFSLCF